MSLRESIATKKSLSALGAVALLLAAATLLFLQNRPDPKPKLGIAFYSADDGLTWFEDSAFRVAPFPHAGKDAVIAQVYTYAGGSKKFVPYLAKYTPEAKQKLEAALAAAQAKNEPPDSVPLFRDRDFLRTGLLYKKPGAKDWVRGDNPKVAEAQSINSPDGSEVDQLFAY